MLLYIIGGKQKATAARQPEWHRFSQGVVLLMDTETGTVESCFEYETPAGARPEKQASVIFKSSTRKDDLIYLCTQTEILIRRLPNFDHVDYFSIPAFNDIHHVRPTSDGMLVVNTGLDMVILLSHDGKVLGEWNVLGKDPWHRFSKDTDYRKVPTTKPHESHPNFVFLHDDDIWVTRFEQKDAISLTGHGKRLDIGIERVHDGVVRGNTAYFTTVNGHVVGFDLVTLRRTVDFNLNDLNPSERSLGWCRGLWFLDDDVIVVGFSRIRKTRFVENLKWLAGHVDESIAGQQATRIAAYNIRQNKLLWEVPVESLGLNAIFSVVG